MQRFLLLSFLLFPLVGCQLPADRLPSDLPDAVGPRPYAELLTRARAQARVATEAFYVNKWGDLEDAARGLEQTGRYLAKAEEVPASRKLTLLNLSEELKKEASQLRKAVMSKDEKETNAILTRINYGVRALRIDE